MRQNFLNTALTLAFMTFITLAPLPSWASGDVQGRFDGKTVCVDGKKEAEFKVPGRISTTHASAQDIKRRIDLLTWHGADEGMSFSDREKEKTELQHALKMLRELSCDDVPDTGTPPDMMHAPPTLTPKP